MRSIESDGQRLGRVHRHAPAVFAVLLALLAIRAVPSARAGQGVVDGGPPDVILIVIDDLGHADVGFTEGRRTDTPAIDSLAREGVVLRNAYVNGPNCAPSRASVMTGTHPARHGITTVFPARRGKAENRLLDVAETARALRPGTPTIATVLADVGYRCVHLGKWHVTADPLAFGFDEALAGDGRGAPRSYVSPYRNPTLADGPDGEYLTDRMASEAERVLASDDERPLFLHLGFFSVHTPIQGRPDLVLAVREEHPELANRQAAYVAMIRAVDEAVGRLRAAIDARDRETVVILISDNGGHGRFADNAPFRGAKGMLYEGGIHVPMSITWPGRLAPRDETFAVQGIDILPTIAAIAGAPAPPCDGVNLLPVLDEDRPLRRDALYWHFPAYLESAGVGDGPWRTTPVGAVRVGDWKLLEWFEDGRFELFDLAGDPGESIDLAASRPAIVEALARRLRAWRSNIGAIVPGPNRRNAP